MELNPAHAFTPVLLALFEAERQRRQQLLAALRKAAGSVTPAPRAVWIEGPHATGNDTADDLLKVGVLTTVRERHAVIEQLQTRLSDIEQRFDVTVDLLVRTRADLETMTSTQQDVVRSGIVMYGTAPLPPTSQSTTGPAGALAITHADVDALSEEKAARVAKAIANDPRLIERAQRWIEQRRPHASDAELHELREWERILSRPPHRIAAFLRDPGERATRLRQTSPFVGFTEAKRGRRGRQ
ncbi:MAG: hypothetical protein C0516_07545 [Gemmatimonas sp.]|nr:hypothetical protein [Gemmatimonas sp.]